MNSLRIKSVNWVAVAAMLALAGPLATSCSKDTNTTEVVDKKGDKLTISVLGINNDASLPTKGGKTAKVTTGASSTAKPKLHAFSDVDMAVSVDNEVPFKASNLSIRNGANGLSSADGLRAEAVEEGVKYVIYLYDGETFVTSAELSSGTTGTIDGLDPNTEYVWIALSYNSTDEAPAPTPAAPSVDLPENTDVLYARGTVKPSEDPTIGIMFDHVYSRIGIELNTIGVFGEITGTPAVSVSGLNLASGSLNLFTGELTPNTTTFTPSLTYADFDDVDPNFQDQKIAYVYTAPVAQQAVQLTVQNLAISHADGNVTRTFFATAATLPAVNVTPVAGQSHRVLFNVVESPLTTTYGGRTVRWGRSNLYYRNNGDPLRGYAFYANNGPVSRADGYFAFGSTIPLRFATSTTQGDPCALVYPAGLWKQPAKADFSGLVRDDIELNQLTGVLGPIGEVVDATGITGLLNIVTNLLGNTVATLVNTAAPNSTLAPTTPYNYGQYALVSQPGVPTSGSNAFGNASHPSNNLRFYYNGQISNLNLLSQVADGSGLLNVGLNDISVDIANFQVVNLNLPLLDSYGRVSALWTNEQGSNIVGLIGAGTWGYLGNAGRGVELTGNLLNPINLNARFHMANNTGELLNGVSALGVDVLSTTLKNVRCVRAN